MEFKDRLEIESNILKKIDEIKKLKNISDVKFCREMNISLNTFKSYKYLRRHISLSFVAKLIDKYDLDANEIFKN